MKTYRLITAVLVLFGFSFYVWNFFAYDLSVTALAPRRTVNEGYQAPFNLVYHFYQAVEENDWDRVQQLVTTKFWAEMHSSGFRQRMQALKEQDPSLNFVMFLVASQKIDELEQWAWIKGKVDWVSANKTMDDQNVFITLIRERNGWKVNSLRTIIPVEIVDHFYEAVATGRFDRIPKFITESYWKQLVAAGVISSVRRDWQRNQTGVYCVFFLDDFGVSTNNAWVKGSVLWNPLTPQEKETPVTVFLQNTGEWKITKISGHWKVSK